MSWRSWIQEYKVLKGPNIFLEYRGLKDIKYVINVMKVMKAMKVMEAMKVMKLMAYGTKSISFFAKCRTRPIFWQKKQGFLNPVTLIRDRCHATVQWQAAKRLIAKMPQNQITCLLHIRCVVLFYILILNIDCRYINTFEKYRYRYGHFWKYWYRYW